ncbi:SNF1-related protein kinase catalytic subunit alpha KIN10 [Choanephora cucurbitarum]|uniref:SNF1-related protein kinase catalytic subunit alpha KIN10 n=1 Tax=Choanephora cucurbitarum TaxID=101091 RepID=A0A1C7NQ46_9FUNG|nr:SNF1-related protein kinase catalytic subunit alpha KIN10 [Choanephora cucurbitarum]
MRNYTLWYAVKVVDKKTFKTGDQKQHALREQTICETFATGLSHRNIVKVYDVLTENDFIYIVMEYVEGGELFEKIKQSKGLAEPTARRWFREIIEAVDYIHDHNIVHRDLKPENVLIDKTHRIRICDFGFGNIIKERHEVLNTYCGSPFYAAPEMVTATPYRGPPVDLWSCGVILFAMLTGSLPFQGDEMPQLFQKISKGVFTIPPYVTRDASDLIQRLLSRDAKERITTKECLLHPWLMPPTMTRCSLLTSSQLTLSSRLTNFSSRKKVNPYPEESCLTFMTTIVNEPKSTHQKIPTVINDSMPPPPSPIILKRRPNAKNQYFFFKLFNRKTQVAPASPILTHHKTEKKAPKQQFFLSRFKGLFKSSFQKRLT